MQPTKIQVTIPEPHQRQIEFIYSQAKRKIIRAGRRSGKTYGIAIYAIEQFLKKKRILYAAPTQEQVARFWYLVCEALRQPIESGSYYKNESEHIIEVRHTENRIKAKTAWNDSTLRGDFADVLILDEFQLMNEDAWGVVGAPMLLDNDGDAVFIYTPPSLRTRSVTKANDTQHASKLFRKAQQDTTGRWKTFNFTSFDNPFLSKSAISDLASDMTSIAYRMEIMAEDIDEAPGALWTRDTIERNRRTAPPDHFDKIVVAIDPAITATGDEHGIIVIGASDKHLYVLEDCSCHGSPNEWAQRAVLAYDRWQANEIVAESNQGGDMVRHTINTVNNNIKVILVHASRSKQTRAEPIAAKYEQDKVHHVGCFAKLEDEQCLWMPGDKSPNRMDALVHGAERLRIYDREAARPF